MDEVLDGFTAIAGGMDAQRDPFLLPEAQCARALNITFRGGLARTRPAFVQELVNLPEGGVFQGATVWRLEAGDVIVFVQDGTLYTLRLTNLKLTDYGVRFNSRSQCAFVPVDQFLVVMDGEQLPVVLEERDNVIKRRPRNSEELDDTVDPVQIYQSLPRARLGIYAHGRIHMVPYKIPSTDDSGARTIVSGDILLPSEPYEVLDFTETEYLAEGGAHSLPFQMGAVGALGVLRNAATGTGMGQVLVMAADGVCGFDFSIPRLQWKEQPLSQVLFFGCGSISPWSVININDDVVYRSMDGIRSIRYTRGQAAGGTGALSNIPMSNEVSTFMEDDAAYLSRVSASTWDNRIFMTCKGVQDGDDHKFKGFTVFDTAASYYNGVQGLGVYDGLWTGLDVGMLLTARREGRGNPTQYILTNDMALFRVDPTAIRDMVPAPNEAESGLFQQSSKIKSRLETRTLAFGDYGTTKRLRWAELWVKDVKITTEIRLWYRPSGYPLWAPLGDSRSINIKATSEPHARRRFRFPVEEVDCACDTTTGEPLWLGTGFQFAIEWTGNLALERFRAAAQPLAEAPPRPCDEEAASISTEDVCAGVVLSDTDYATGFNYRFDTGVSGGRWDLLTEPEAPKPTPDPVVEPGFPEDPPLPDPPPQPVNPGDGGEGDQDDDSGPGPGGGYTPPDRDDEEEEPDPDAPPYVRTSGVSNRTTTSATISGYIVGMSETHSVATAYFKYRKSSDSAWVTSATSSINSTVPTEENFTANLTGLTPDTDYRYQAWASLPGLDSELSGAVLGFRTLVDPSLQTFSVLTLTAGQIGPSAAMLKGALAAFPAEGVYDDLKIYFKYKKTTDTSYIKTADITLSALSAFSQAITGLAPETQYVFSAWGEYEGQAVTGVSKYFTTLAVGAGLPVVETIMAVPAAEEGVFSLTASVVSLGTEVSVAPFMQIREVGTDTWTDIVIEETISTAPTSFSADSAPLDAATDYEFRGGVEWVDLAGTTRQAFGEIIPITGVLVETGPAYPRDNHTAAMLTGQLSEMGSLESGVLFFEYRIIDDPENAWTSVDVETAWDTTEIPFLFHKTITGLDNTVGVEYEYRAGIRYDTPTHTGLTFVGEIATIPVAFAVRTVGATAAVKQMTVTGEIVVMGDYDGLAVSRFVEYRVEPPEVGPPADWTRVAITGTQSAAGTFSLTITGLSPTANTTYEYRVGCAYAGADIGFGDVLSIWVPSTIEYIHVSGHVEGGGVVYSGYFKHTLKRSSPTLYESVPPTDTSPYLLYAGGKWTYYRYVSVYAVFPDLLPPIEQRWVSCYINSSSPFGSYVPGDFFEYLTVTPI